MCSLRGSFHPVTVSCIERKHVSTELEDTTVTGVHFQILLYLLYSLFLITSPEFADLEFFDRVGRGGYGQVWKGLWKSRNMTVAIKKVTDLPEAEVSLWLWYHILAYST